MPNYMATITTTDAIEAEKSLLQDEVAPQKETETALGAVANSLAADAIASAQQEAKAEWAITKAAVVAVANYLANDAIAGVKIRDQG